MNQITFYLNSQSTFERIIDKQGAMVDGVINLYLNWEVLQNMFDVKFMALSRREIHWNTHHNETNT